MKKFFEFFDNDDLRNHYEIPHIKGDMPDILKKDFKKMNIASNENETPQTFCERILFKYEVLEKFNMVENRGSILLYSRSKTPINEITYYTQIGFYCENGEYEIGVLFRDDSDYDQNNWQIKIFVFDKIEDSYPIVDAFLNAFIELQVIKKSDKLSIKDN
jgi:hypothetical protein